MIIGDYDLSIGNFYTIENDENNTQEMAILVSIKIDSICMRAEFLTFNGFYKTKEIKQGVILPNFYSEITSREVLDMIEVIANKIANSEGMYFDEYMSLIRKLITRFLLSRNIGV